MGYDRVTWNMPVEARLSRHNDERDAEDNDAWEGFQLEASEAIGALEEDPRFARIFGKELEANNKGETG